MEMAALVIGVIAMLALTQGGSISGKLNVTPNQPIGLLPPGSTGPILGGPVMPVSYPPLGPEPIYVGPAALPPPPQAYTPVAAAPFNPPQVPYTGSNVDGAILTGTAAVGTGVLNAAGNASSAAAGGATALSAAVPIVGAAIAAAVAIGTALLAAHKARLTGATNENQAVDQWVPVFDSFVSQAVGAYNAKQISASTCANICQQFDQFLYSKLRSFVGQPGTQWSDSVGKAGQCNSSCTVGCCVYWQDLSVVLNDISYVLGFPTGKWGAGDPRINGRTITVPKVYPSKYSSYTRALYTIHLN